MVRSLSTQVPPVEGSRKLQGHGGAREVVDPQNADADADADAEMVTIVGNGEDEFVLDIAPQGGLAPHRCSHSSGLVTRFRSDPLLSSCCVAAFQNSANSSRLLCRSNC